MAVGYYWILQYSDWLLSLAFAVPTTRHGAEQILYVQVGLGACLQAIPLLHFKAST